MTRRLPPLNAVRAFESAGRHESFKRAAGELNVTASAVSQQVQLLEDFLGVALFERHPRGLRLTTQGRTYLSAASTALDQLIDATRRARAPDDNKVLTVSTTASFATQWLVPRLWAFGRHYPDIDVRVSASDRHVDLAAEDVDLAIRHGRGGYRGVETELLIEDRMTPVCSPSLLQGRHPLKNPEDLRYQTLLHLDAWPLDELLADWSSWCAAAGVSDIDTARGPRFSEKYLTIQEAVAGRGVTLAPLSLVAEELAAGRLVAPFDLWIPAGANYYLLYLPEALDKSKVRAFRDWIVAARDEAPQNDSHGAASAVVPSR